MTSSIEENASTPAARAEKPTAGLETSNAAPMTDSVTEFTSTLTSRGRDESSPPFISPRTDCRPRFDFSYPRVSAFICGPILFSLRNHTPSLTSIPALFNHIPLCSRATPSPLPHNPDVVRAWPGRSLLFSGIRASGTRGFIPGPSWLAAPETLRRGRDTEENRFSG
jgi:hypothetical protein